MKHVKLFEQFLAEFETGSILLGDPEGVDTKGNKSEWETLGLPFEPNTMDEKQLLDLLRAWITKEDKNPKLGKLLKELLPLKKKFPKILEPTQGRRSYEGKHFYRGTMVPIREIIALSGWFKNNSVDFDNGAIETKSSYIWKSVNTKGFTSLTPSPETATQFAEEYALDHGFDPEYFVEKLANEDFTGMMPIVIKVKDTHPDTVMNPDFINTLTSLREWETFLISGSTKVDAVIVPLWNQITDIADGMEVNLTKYFKGL